MGFLKKLTETFKEVFFSDSGEKRKAKKKSSSRPKKKSSSAKSKPVKTARPAKKVPAKIKKVSPKPVLQKTLKVKAAPAKALKPVAKAPASKTVAGKSLPKTKLPKAIPVPAEKPPVQPGILAGEVTHYFAQVKVAAIKLKGPVAVGDMLQFHGATTDFKMKINSMQINRVPVTQAAKGAEIGILAPKRVREGDQVYKL
jgi:hypothetical protein